MQYPKDSGRGSTPRLFRQDERSRLAHRAAVTGTQRSLDCQAHANATRRASLPRANSSPRRPSSDVLESLFSTGLDERSPVTLLGATGTRLVVDSPLLRAVRQRHWVQERPRAAENSLQMTAEHVDPLFVAIRVSHHRLARHHNSQIDAWAGVSTRPVCPAAAATAIHRPLHQASRGCSKPTPPSWLTRSPSLWSCTRGYGRANSEQTLILTERESKRSHP
jgi:hypothetical protein